MRRDCLTDVLLHVDHAEDIADGGIDVAFEADLLRPQGIHHANLVAYLQMLGTLVDVNSAAAQEVLTKDQGR